jgi:hypothetical protein
VLIVGLVIIPALAPPLLATSDPIDQDLIVVLKPPFWLADGALRYTGCACNHWLEMSDP